MISYLIIYVVVGILFMLCIRTDLNNQLYNDLTLYYYDWSKTIQKKYIIYMFVIVFIFWPFFALTIALDVIKFKVVDKDNQSNT